MSRKRSLCDDTRCTEEVVSIDSGDQCAICLEPLADKQCASLDECGHTFHTSCILKSMRTVSVRCPLCRHSPLDDEEEGESHPCVQYEQALRRGRVMAETDKVLAHKVALANKWNEKRKLALRDQRKARKQVKALEREVERKVKIYHRKTLAEAYEDNPVLCDEEKAARHRRAVAERVRARLYMAIARLAGFDPPRDWRA